MIRWVVVLFFVLACVGSYDPIKLTRKCEDSDCYVYKRQHSMNKTYRGKDWLPPPTELKYKGIPIASSLRLYGILLMFYQFVFIMACITRIYYVGLEGEPSKKIKVFNLPALMSSNQPVERNNKRRKLKTIVPTDTGIEMTVLGNMPQPGELLVEMPISVSARDKTLEDVTAVEPSMEVEKTQNSKEAHSTETQTVTQKKSTIHQSSKLPRAKKGNQTDFLNFMEAICLNETLEEGGSPKKKIASAETQMGDLRPNSKENENKRGSATTNSNSDKRNTGVSVEKGSKEVATNNGKGENAVSPKPENQKAPKNE